MHALPRSVPVPGHSHSRTQSSVGKSQAMHSVPTMLRPRTALPRSVPVPGHSHSRTHSSTHITPSLFFPLLPLLLLLTPLASLSAEKTTYDEHVVPILRNNCFNCHNSDKKKADLDLSTYNGIIAGGGSGPALVSSDPAASLLWKLINHLEDPTMPPRGPKLPDADLAVIKRWIEGGLIQNPGGTAVAAKKPKVALALASSSPGKPDGPPPMPNGDLLLEPVLRAERPGAVTALAASPWAPLAAVAGQKQVFLYHLDTLRLEGILPFKEGFPSVLSFSQNARLLLVAGGIPAKSGKAVLYDVTAGKRITELGDELDTVLAADISPDQTQVALGGPSKAIRIYSTATGELLHTIRKHTDWVTTLAFSPDGVLLASADRNGAVHVWETATAQPYSELKGHKQGVTDLAWRDDSNVLATTGDDGQIMLWELENSTRVKNWAAHPGGSLSVSFAHDGRLVSCGHDRLTKIWDANGKQERAFERFADIALAASISHDTTKVFAGDYTGEIRVWTTADGKLAGKLDPNPPPLAERIAAGTKTLEQLTASRAQLDSQKTAAAEHVKKAEAALQKAKADLDAATAKSNAMASQVASVENQLARWKAAQINVQVLAAAEELAQAEQAANSKAEAAAKLKTEADFAANQLADAERAIVDAAALLRAKSNDVLTASSTLQSAKAALPPIETALAAAESRAAQTTRALDQAKSALTQSESLRKSREGISTALANNHTNASATAAQTSTAAAAAPDAADLKLVADKTRAAAAELSAALETANKSLADAQDQVRELAAAHANAEAEASTAAAALAEAKQAAEKQPAIIQQAEAALEAATTALTQAQTNLAQRADKLQALKKTAADSAQATQSAQKEADTASAKLATLRQKHQTLLTLYRTSKP